MFGREHLERALKAEARVELLLSMVEKLREQLHEVDKKNAVLLERLDLVANYGMGTSKATGPNVLPEEAEDAMFAYRAGLLQKEDLEKTLAQAGFDNAEIEFDAADYPRLNSQ